MIKHKSILIAEAKKRNIWWALQIADNLDIPRLTARIVYIAHRQVLDPDASKKSIAQSFCDSSTVVADTDALREYTKRLRKQVTMKSSYYNADRMVDNLTASIDWKLSKLEKVIDVTIPDSAETVQELSGAKLGLAAIHEHNDMLGHRVVQTQQVSLEVTEAKDKCDRLVAEYEKEICTMLIGSNANERK
jgi:hypothetical protein